MATKKWKEENADKMREYRRDYYYRNKESHYQRNEKTELKLRDYMKSQKNPCLVCGENETSCIDFHHLRDKDMDVSKMVKYGSLKKLKEEIEKCVCLCANCHRKLHAGIITLNAGVM